MNVTLPLDKMSIKEKIQTMETIWEDLCKKADSIPSPAWHKDILEEREKAIENGKEEFIDWSEAKKQQFVQTGCKALKIILKLWHD